MSYNAAFGIGAGLGMGLGIALGIGWDLLFGSAYTEPGRLFLGIWGLGMVLAVAGGFLAVAVR